MLATVGAVGKDPELLDTVDAVAWASETGATWLPAPVIFLNWLFDEAVEFDEADEDIGLNIDAMTLLVADLPEHCGRAKGGR